MSHTVEVDQSGKIEFTGEDTVLAFANGQQFSVLIPATVKRECERMLRERGVLSETRYLLLFATGLFLLLKDYIEGLSRVMIDTEYSGKEAFIKEHLINLLRRAGKVVEVEQIEFVYVGKKSPAHELAIDTLRRRKQPNKVLSAQDMLGEFGKSRRERRKGG